MYSMSRSVPSSCESVNFNLGSFQVGSVCGGRLGIAGRDDHDFAVAEYNIPVGVLSGVVSVGSALQGSWSQA